MPVTGEDLAFAIALPEEWSYVDLLDPGVSEWAGPELAAALAAARQTGGAARMLMMRSLIAHTPEGEPLTAGVTVALADNETRVASEPLQDISLPGAQLSAVALPAGDGVRVRRLVRTPPLPDGDEIPMLSLQYLLHTPHGLLTIGFTTGQASHPEAWEQLFDAMAETAELA
jgi:hypothetical protein